MTEKKGTKIPTVNAAATDPGAVPGLVPAHQEPEPETQDQAQAGVETDEDGDGVEAEAAEDAADAGDAAESAGEDEDGESTDEDEADGEPGDGPAFEASDRRGSIAVDADGVRFTLDDTEADFGWDEIGAVEWATSRFGRRLTVTVHTRRRREYPAEVAASSKAALNEWTTSLDEALDAYLDE
ncbi:hypothetical protein [Streptomyces boninensis]|uniref:hypothetical protein n=1 Tax=Streptomyces boninensis TaxID=2039455 RepID=UPI003B224639